MLCFSSDAAGSWYDDTLAARGLGNRLLDKKELYINFYPLPNLRLFEIWREGVDGQKIASLRV